MYDEERAKKQLDWLKKRKKDVDKRERVKNKDRNDRRKAAQTPTRGVSIQFTHKGIKDE